MTKTTGKIMNKNKIFTHGTKLKGKSFVLSGNLRQRL